MALGRLGGAEYLDPAGLDPTGIAYVGWVAESLLPSRQGLGCGLSGQHYWDHLGHITRILSALLRVLIFKYR